MRIIGIEQPEQFYDRIYSGDYPESAYDFLFSQTIKYIEMIGARKILDVCCGTGRMAELLLTEKSSQIYDYVGFDFSEEAIIKAQNKQLNASFLIGNAYDDQFYAERVDVVLVLEALEHLDDFRVLNKIKSGTYIIGSVPNFDFAGHVRTYTKDSVVERYKDIIDFKRLMTFSKGRQEWYLFLGIKK